MPSSRSSAAAIARVLPRLAAASALLATLTSAPAARAQEPDEEARRRAMAQRALEAAQAGPEHERLAALAGDWNVTISTWTTPTAAPLVATGSATNRMILGGRFLSSETSATLGDRAAESISMLGYDRRSNRYTIAAFDTRGTHYLTAEGLWDAGSRALTMYGEKLDLIANRTEHYTMVVRRPGPDEYILEISFRLPSGESFRAVEVRHTRRKRSPGTS